MSEQCRLRLIIIHHTFKHKACIADAQDLGRIKLQSNPLMPAVQNGHFEIVRRLLADGSQFQVNITLRQNAKTSASLGHLDITAFLLRRIPTREADTCFHDAIHAGQLKQVKALLDADAESENPQISRYRIDRAAIAGHADIVKYLLTQDRHLERLHDFRCNNTTYTKLAGQRGHKKVLEILLEDDRLLEEREILAQGLEGAKESKNEGIIRMYAELGFCR